MIQRLILIAFSVLLCTSVYGKKSPQDSLLHALSKAQVPQNRFSIYRNLADLSHGYPNEINYLSEAFKIAHQIKDNVKEIETLRDIFIYYSDKNNIDSASHYLNKVKAFPDIVEKPGCITYMNMSYFKLLHALNESEDMLEEEKNRALNQNGMEPYERLESAYIIGNAIFKDDNPIPAFSYIKQACDLSKELPLKDWYKVKLLTLKNLAHYYLTTEEYQKAIELSEEILSINNQYYEKYIGLSRPFYNKNGLFLSDVNTIIIALRMTNPNLLHSYIAKIKPMLEQATSPRDKYNGFLCLNNYYLSQNNIKLALSTNDSLIKYAKTIFPENIPGLYSISSQIYEATEEYEKALSALKMSHKLQDSLTTNNTQELLSELQVKYNLGNLNYEKSQLEVRNKQIIVTCLGFILFIAIGLCLYLYRIVKKERLMKKHVRELQLRAEESEKMKTAFINSVCHEIRTPLNGIVGFSNLLFDDNIDEETKKLFPDEIKKNTSLLTSLIDCMLEVSKLDVSNDKLPCTLVNINKICEKELEQIKYIGNHNLQYYLQMPQEEIIINSHERYLPLVLEQLLSNASKFTHEGSVTINVSTDTQKNKLIIRVSDTGCGVPLDKHSEIFERFIKLNDFATGSGLGLYLCRLIVTRLNGDINIDSNYTNGASFIVRLPM